MSVTSLFVFTNPARDWIYIKNNHDVLKNEDLDIMDFTGKIVLSNKLDNDGKISIKELNEGFCLVNSKFGILKLIVKNK